MPTLLQYFAQQVQMLEEDEDDLDAPPPEGKFQAPSIAVQQVPATPVIGGISSSAAITAFIGVHGGPIPAAAGAVGQPNPEQALPDAGIDMEQDRKRKENPLDNPEAADPLEQQAEDDFFGHLGAEADPIVQQRLLDEAAASAGKTSSSSSSSSSSAVPDPKRTKGGPTMAEITLLMEQAGKDAQDDAKGITLSKDVVAPASADGASTGAKLLG